MRVLQINAVYGYGSSGRAVKDLHEFLQSQGVESYVATSDKRSNSDSVVRIGNFYDHKFHALYSRLFGLQGYFSYVSTLLFLRKISHIKPDIVHLHNLHSNYIHLPLLLKYLAKNDIVTFVTLHDCWFYTGHCCHYTDVGCSKWRLEGCHNCVAIKKYNKSWFFDFTRKKFADKAKLFQSLRSLVVVGVSEWITNEVRQSILKESKIVTRIYNWIDQDIFYPREKMDGRAKFGFKDCDFIIFGVAQDWTNAKGLDVFIEIAERCPSYKVVLVGACYDVNTTQSNILFAGTIADPGELAELYSMSDLFVNPSIQESFGKVTAEALSCGVPCIVNNATANSELLGVGCGYLVSDNSIEDYLCHIATIAKNGKKHYSDSCMAFAQKFRKEKLLLEHLALYNNVL